MSTQNDAGLLTYNDKIFRFRASNSADSRLVLMLHGWTGDENSMWVFARKIDVHKAVLAPRGIYKVVGSGYSWCNRRSGQSGFPVLIDFRNSVNHLLKFIDEWSPSIGLNVEQFDLIGFSQGAALSYVISLLHPERVGRMAVLSGFLPAGCEGLLTKNILKDKEIYIAHGIQDELVPIREARKAATFLESGGAKVTYCESDVGHKVSSDCLSAVADFLE